MPGLHLCSPPNQPPLIVPPHPQLALHPSDLSAYVHQQMIYAATHPHYSSLHPEMRAHEAQARAAAAAMGLQSRFPYSPGFAMQLATGENRSADRSGLNSESAQTLAAAAAARAQEEKVLQLQKGHKIKSDSDRDTSTKSSFNHLRSSILDDTELKRQSEVSPMHPPLPLPLPLTPLRIPTGLSYPPFSLLPLSPHERFTDSPAILHAYHQGLPIVHPGKSEDLKAPSIIKPDDRDSKTIPAHSKSFTNSDIINRPTYGIPGSPAPGYMEPRFLHQSASSPGALNYRKEALTPSLSTQPPS